MDEQDDAVPNEYPIGRGYGHDYMRGGEVFDGYGYSRRAAYERQRGGERPPLELAPPLATDEGAGEGVQDAAGEVPEPRAAAPRSGAERTDAAPPVPQLEGAFGSSGPSGYSRSFYVTQAQLQQRIYGGERTHGTRRGRLRTVPRRDQEIKRDVEETLFYDSVVGTQRVEVAVAGGVVLLRGVLPTAEAARCACEDAWEVPGVREVRSELRVRATEGSGGAARPLVS